MDILHDLIIFEHGGARRHEPHVLSALRQRIRSSCFNSLAGTYWPMRMLAICPPDMLVHSTSTVSSLFGLLGWITTIRIGRCMMVRAS